MTSIGIVIGWKFNHQSGMRTHDGKITEFPGGDIPSQEDQDLWTAEYEARDIGAEEIEQQFMSRKDMVIFEVFLELINDVRVLQGKGTITKAQFKDFLKTKLGLI